MALIVLISVAITLVPAAAHGAAREPETQTDSITVEAYIDGRSQLILSGSSAQWHHFNYAAPGRWRLADEPTIINGVEWFPTWPDVPDPENRCGECYSSVFTGVSPPLPPTKMDVELVPIQSRFETSVVQYPTPSNGYSLVIEFNDNRPWVPIGTLQRSSSPM